MPRLTRATRAGYGAYVRPHDALLRGGMPRRTELESPKVGSGLRPVPCHTSARASEPPPTRPGHPRIGLTFSGGGFRATLAALGAARLLASIGRLEDVRLVSSISGGSIANGLLARRWPEPRAAGFTPAAVDELCVQPACERIAGEAFKRVLLRNAWRALGPAQRTDVLARCLDDWFFERCEGSRRSTRARASSTTPRTSSPACSCLSSARSSATT